MLQHLSLDELLTTTRSVRKGLDFTRPVEQHLIDECLTIAQQAPTPSNMQSWHFVVVTDPGKRAALAEVYRRGVEIYLTLAIAALNLKFDNPERAATQSRVTSSIQYLADHMQEAPVHVIPCITFPGSRLESQPPVVQTSWWSSIAQAGWSFILAARSRGLGATWTTLHLLFEEEAAKLLGIPYEEVNQAALIAVAYTRGTSFRPAPREPLNTMVHREGW